jgi:DNA replication protein DnaC
MEFVMKIKDSVKSKLLELKLSALWQGIEQQLKSTQYDELGFLERLDDALEYLVLDVNNKRIDALRRQAKLRWPSAQISDLKFDLQKGLKKTVVANLAELKWIDSNLHIVITGPTGTGKTHLACAFANKALDHKVSVGFFRFNELLLQLLAASKNDELVKLRKKLCRYRLLIIDDWAVSPLSSEQRHLLFDLVEARDKASSLIITSQYAPDDWYDAFQDPTIADSVLDRIVHAAHVISVSGDSMREHLGIKGGKNG